MLRLEVCGLGARCPGDPRTAALVRPRDGAEGHRLALEVGAGDAHSLQHELRGEETARSQALGLVSQIARALGGAVVAARLLPDGTDRLRAELELAGTEGTVRVPATPGQALAVSLRLGVPLLGDPSLFGPARPSDPIAAFLETLDLTGLEEPRP